MVNSSFPVTSKLQIKGSSEIIDLCSGRILQTMDLCKRKKYLDNQKYRKKHLSHVHTGNVSLFMALNISLL